MVRSTWAELTADLEGNDLAMIHAYCEICRKLPGIEERVNRTDISYAVKRTFTSAYVKNHWLEMSVDLLREAKHPQLRTAFHTTKTFITHRLTISTVAQVRSAEKLIREACETVGPGTR
ncbi:hypothetical protein BH10ACT7_BH10ACT7_30000 [soil metagenome]